MLKKIVSVVMCCMLIVANSNISVFAESRHTFTLDDYSGYGEVSISETGASAKTYISSMVNVYVYAEYNYVVDRNASPATTAMSPNSVGNYGTAYVTFSKPSPSRSISIFGTHTFNIPGILPITLPRTNALYP